MGGGTAWAGAPKRIQRDMLRVIFEAVYVNVLGRRLVCVKPYPQFTPLFRMDGLEVTENDSLHYEEEETEARPRVEQLLQLILEARRARVQAIKTRV